MKISLLFCLIFYTATLLASNAKVLVYTPKLQKISQADTRIAIETILYKIAEEADFDSVKIEYSDQLSHAVSQYKQGVYEALHMNSLALMSIFPELKTQTAQYWNFSKVKGKRLRNFYILVRNDSKINSLASLQNRPIALTLLDSMQTLFLNHMMLKINHSSFENFCGNVIYNTKDATSILNLFFNKVDMAVVTQHSYNTAIELNPQLQKKLTILYRSETIYPAPSITLVGNKNRYFQQIFQQYSQDLVSNTFGRQLMMIYQSVDDINLTEEEMERLYEHYQDYMKLKHRYEP